MKKIEKIVKAYKKYAAIRRVKRWVNGYNKRASLSGYSTIEVDYENKKVIGEFTPKESNHGFSWDWYYKDWFDRIVNELSKC